MKARKTETLSKELTREYLNELRKVIESKNDSAALHMLEDLHPADIAEIYEGLSLEETTSLFLLLDPELAADVLVDAHSSQPAQGGHESLEQTEVEGQAEDVSPGEGIEGKASHDGTGRR